MLSFIVTKTGSQVIRDVHKCFRFQTHEISVAHDNEHTIFNMSVTVRFVILVFVVGGVGEMLFRNIKPKLKLILKTED